MLAPFVPVIFRGETMHGYRIASDGRIWSDKSGKLLRPYPSGTMGYPTVALRVDGKTVRACVHWLVAEVFIGPRPLSADVCHNDGVVTHSAAANLRYASRADNLSDRELHETAQRGQRNPAATLTDEQAEQIRVRRAVGEPLKILAAAFAVRESTISRIANGKRRASP